MAVPSKNYQGVMVSSTFTDLHIHRRALLDVIAKFELMPIGMENDGARADVDVIGSSLGFVRDAAAYIGVIGHKYGQTPECPDHNPDSLSITELEFNEAMDLDRPILLFLMADDHPVTKADIERDPVKQEKLERFIERAKAMREGSPVHRVYETFNSPEDFASRAGIAVGRLADLLKQKVDPEPPAVTADEPAREETALPNPPELRAVPRYMGSHKFVGRASELETLNEWAGEADPDPMLLFEAIGGSGKSMLTWEWVTYHAVTARKDWAGRFWYSFYEPGARMIDFCREALAYMTGKSRDDYKEFQIGELSERLINELELRPWLLALDGLERVLVIYNRSDAARLKDDEVDTAVDMIAHRDKRAAVRPADDDLLRQLANVKPSKILVTSRLTPRALINPSNTPMPGVRREFLSGLRPADAEALMQSAGIHGNSKAIQDYIHRNCDCHPLVVGVLAGLINDYLPDRGNFDAWLHASDGGRALNLADLNLVGRQNHILDAAMEALAPKALHLLQMLALLQHGADYDLLQALNPHLEPRSENGEQPSEAKAKQAATCLKETVLDLERRGLIQYERDERRYDLHPVVRAVASGRMASEERQERGEEVVSYFTTQARQNWSEVRDFKDLMPGLQLISTLTQLGRFKEALVIYEKGLSKALRTGFEANEECLSLLKPFFPAGWDADPIDLGDYDHSQILFEAAQCFLRVDVSQGERLAERNLLLSVEQKDVVRAWYALHTILVSWHDAGRLARRFRILALMSDLAAFSRVPFFIFKTANMYYEMTSEIGDHQNADRIWVDLQSMARHPLYVEGNGGRVEVWNAYHRLQCGDLDESHLINAETLVQASRERHGGRFIARVRGQYHLLRGEVEEAAESFQRAVRMAREVGFNDARAEAWLALARQRAGDAFNARGEAERLDREPGRPALAVAELWRELGETERAIAVARRAHDWAVADGEPYVFRYELNRTRALLKELGAELPEVPTYDPANDPPFDWETDVRNMIEKLKAERAEESERA